MLEITDMMLVDAVLDAYFDWREGEVVVRSTHDVGCAPPREPIGVLRLRPTPRA
jgi:hypothetical protein